MLSFILKIKFQPTRNPPLGLVTSVVPMVMFSLTSFKLGIVVFSKRKIWINQHTEEHRGRTAG